MITREILINNYLSASLVAPNNDFIGKIPLILFLHGFGTDKNEVGDTFLILANKLAEHMIASLRIDFSGFAKSQGKTHEVTIDKLLADANAAINFILQLPYVDATRIGLCGFSLGAGISVLVSLNHAIKSMGLLCPAGNLSEDFKNYFGEENFKKIENSVNPIEIDLGWRKIKLKRDFILSLSKYFLIPCITQYKGAFFVAAGTGDFSYNHAKEYYNKAATANKISYIINNADHIFNAFEKHSAIEEITDNVTNWFQKTLK